MSVQIVEPWHPDLLTRKFIDDLFAGKNKYEARRFVEKNPCDVRGHPPQIKPGEIVRAKSKTVYGIVLETYLVERWVNRGFDVASKARPHAYELNCLIKWMPKQVRTRSLKVPVLTEETPTEIIPAVGLTSVSREMEALRKKTEQSVKKLKEWDDSNAALMEAYNKHTAEPRSIDDVYTAGFSS